MTERTSANRLYVGRGGAIPATCLLVVACIASAARAWPVDPPDKAANQPLSDPDVAVLDRLSRAFGVIAEKVQPSVVSIRSLMVNEEVNERLRQMFDDDNFQAIPLSGTGSGIILDQAGHIVTNNHVVEDADSVRVTLADGREFQALVVGTDSMTDLAVIKIDAEGLVPAHLGDSDAVRVGNIVLAIGSPFRFGHSVSHGIISAIGRTEVDVDIDYKNWLQTDAPINPGNSGGPLINTRGEVIGLSVAIATESGGYQGVGFAIPSNTVARITEVLKSGQEVVRGYLGVGIRPIDPNWALAYGLKEPRGVFIDAVADDSPAAKGGLKQEDIVLEIGDVKVRTREHLQDLVAQTPPGTEVKFTIWRKDRERPLKITIGKQPPGFTTNGSLPHRGRQDEADEESGPPEESHEELDAVVFEALGLEVTTVTPRIVRQFKLPSSSTSGALITRVDPLSDAFQARLRRGLVIVGVNDRKVRSAADLDKALKAESGEKVVRLQIRAGREEYITVLRLR